MVMLAFSAVTQFPTNGSSTRTAGEGVQASTSAEHVMTVEKRNRIAAAGYHSHVVARLARRYSHQDPMRPHLRSAPDAAQDEGRVRLPKGSPARASANMVEPVCHRVENYT